MAPVVRVIRPGDTTKPNPFTICVVANPALEVAWHGGQFIVDPITEDQSAFDAAVAYVEQALFGRLLYQAERFLGDPAIEPAITMISVFVPGLPLEDANSLVAQDAVSDLLIARVPHSTRSLRDTDNRQTSCTPSRHRIRTRARVPGPHRMTTPDQGLRSAWTA